VTRNHDWTEAEPYVDVVSNEWTRVEGADVLYLRSRQIHPGTLLRLLRSETYDILYLHSLFSGTMTVSPLLFRRLGLTPKVPVVVAPRGQLSPAALSIRKSKKRAFLPLARRLGLYDDVIWQASTRYEAEEIERHFGNGSPELRLKIAPDLATLETAAPRSTEKRAGELRAVWLSRITPKKNLLGALDILAGIGLPVTFDVYGLIEDEAHWRDCRMRMAALPAEISVSYRGSLPYPDVVPTLARYDLFFFPSLGENFGHVILEALAAGCPILTSNETGFRDLEGAGVGWALALSDVEAFRTRIRSCIAMDRAERDRIAQRALEFARRYLQDERSVEANRALFREAAEQANQLIMPDGTGVRSRAQNIA
jgi:glycosyltransferase involved in cell wall biosynthesis